MRTAEVNIEDLSSPNWRTKSGGFGQQTGEYCLYAYLPYEETMKLVSCSGKHNSNGNNTLVYIHPAKSKSRYYKGYNILKTKAGPKPPSLISIRHPKGEPPCTKKIIFLLSGGSKTRGTLRNELLDIGYHKTTIRNAINRLKKNEKIICEGSSHSKKQKLSLNPT